MSTTMNEGTDDNNGKKEELVPSETTDNKKNLFQVSILNMKKQNEENNIYEYDHNNTNSILYYDVFDFSSKITENGKKVLLYIFRKVFEKVLTDGNINSNIKINDYKKYHIEIQEENIKVSKKEEEEGEEEDDEEMAAMQARIAALRSEGGNDDPISNNDWSTDIFYYKHNIKDENLKVIQMSLLNIDNDIVSKENYIVDYGDLSIKNTENVQNILKIMTEVFKIKISNEIFLNMINNYQNIINDNTKKNFYNTIDDKTVNYFEKDVNDDNLKDVYEDLLSQIQRESQDDTILKIQTENKSTTGGITV